MNCVKCNSEIPKYIFVENKKHKVSNNRKYCFECKPFGCSFSKISKLEEISKEELQTIFNESNSYKDVLKKVGLVPIGNNYTTLNKVIKKYNINTEEINKNRIKRNKRSKNFNTKEEFIQLLNNNKINKKRILKNLIEYKIKEYKCEICGIKKWNNKDITLELHHIDGNNENNLLNNLQILCPNCHSQTDNFRYKNRKSKLL